MTGGTDLTILVALAAGRHQLPVAVRPAARAGLPRAAERDRRRRGRARTGADRWLAIRHAIAFVAGFTAVFTLLGVTATYLASGSRRRACRRSAIIGGASLIVLGLNLAGHPAHPGPRAHLAAARCRCRRQPGDHDRLDRPRDPGGPDARPGLGDRLGGRLVGTNGGWLASLGLGAIFAIGWTPCIGIILGGILTMAATSGTVAQGAAAARRLLPRARACRSSPSRSPTTGRPGCLRPLVRHGRTVSLIGGLLVGAIGVAMVFDLLRLLPRYFTFLTAI